MIEKKAQTVGLCCSSLNTEWEKREQLSFATSSEGATQILYLMSWCRYTTCMKKTSSVKISSWTHLAYQDYSTIWNVQSHWSPSSISSQSIFKAMECQSFWTNDIDADNETSSYLVADWQIRCDDKSDEYEKVQRVFWVFSVVWPALSYSNQTPVHQSMTCAM